SDVCSSDLFAPFTTVNGKVWPVLEVQPATYRFRVLNGSNARTFRLVLFGDGTPELGRVTQIGTDHGLLRTPVSVPPEGLVLASAEREHQSLRRHADGGRSEEHTSELQSRGHLVCRLLLEKKKHKTYDEQVTSQ